MLVRTLRTIAAASMLSAGLTALPGCNSETPTEGTPTTGTSTTGTPTTIQKIEDKASKTLEKVEAAGAGAVDKTGKAIENVGEKLETSGKDAVKEHVGDKAASVVEGAGKGLGKAGEKIQESVKKKD